MVEDSSIRLELLLVEGDDSRIERVRDALAQSRTRCQLRTVNAGRRALGCLRHKEPYDDVPTPDLILLDLSELAKCSLWTLDRIRADKSLRDIPLVLLTNENSERWIEETYGAKDSCAIFSPIELYSFFQAMQSFDADRFLGAVRLIASLGFVQVRVHEEPIEKE